VAYIMVTALPAMSGVSEQMQEGASEEQQVRQHTEDVRGVLGDQKERGDAQKQCQRDPCAGSEKASGAGLFLT
jgi:hypothetical protein